VELSSIFIPILLGSVLIVLVALVVLIVLVARGRGDGRGHGRGDAETDGGTGARAEAQLEALTSLEAQLLLAQQKFDDGLARMDGLIRDEFGRNREETLKQQQATREETSKTLLDSRSATEQTLLATREETSKALLQNREELGRQLKEIRETMETRLLAMQGENALKLEEMRKTVDEKLQETVEKRFAESFNLISDRLEQVHKGLGEMQTLANGVGDLKKVLTNVKTRGNLGEFQLGAILEQFLSPEQYVINAQTKKRSQERVEFAVKLPGRGAGNASSGAGDTGGTEGVGGGGVSGAGELLLPIDSKFPIEDYERLLDAYEGTGTETPEAVIKRLEISLKRFARSIRDKYINPPTTTDFAILFVPTEGLYAEILRIPGLFDTLQREFHVTVVGPTNLVAFLSSLQMGFRTLAVEKRSSEVWNLLGQVKTEFGKFASVLEGVKKKLAAASNEIDRVGTRTNVITRKLQKVQTLPALDAPPALEASPALEILDATDLDSPELPDELPDELSE
jgi:DNA recombination protein RmuC